MRQRLLLIIFLIVFQFNCISVETSNQNSLVGQWKLLYEQIDGKTILNEESSKSSNGRMIISNTEINYLADLPGFKFTFAYTVNIDNNPESINLTLTDLSDKEHVGQKMKGIYSVKTNVLKLCLNKNKRPANMEAKKGSGDTLIVLTKKP